MKRLLISLAILALAVFAVALTQTGNLIVSIMSEEGQILPGTTVTVTSSVLMGARVQTTGANGKATFRNLPPGDYVVEVTMDGFQTARQSGIEIRVQKTSKIDIALKLGQAREVIEVVGTGPIVDTTSNTIVSEFDFENYINHQPTYRHYVSVGGLAGGVVAGNNPNAGGGGQYENSYLIDGTNSMDSRTHTWGNQFNVDTIADMTLMRAGATAEFGHAMGAIFNIVTKSGSNEITALGRVELWRMNWNDLSENNPATAADNTRGGRYGQVWNIAGGGPLYPDMIWWYVGYSKYVRDTAFNRRLNVMNYSETTPAVVTYYGHLFSVKGTIQAGENLKAQVLYREDPIDLYNENSGRYYGTQCLPAADEVQNQGGWDLMFNVSAVLTESTFVEASYSMDRTTLQLVAQGDDPSGEGKWTRSYDTPGITSYYSMDGWRWGSIPDDYHSDRNADTVRGAVNLLLQTSSLGDHDIKLGIEWMDEWGVIRDTYYPGNEFIVTDTLTGVGFDAVPYLYRYTYQDRLPELETHGKYWTGYLQDSAQVTDNLTVNLGVRTDIGYLYDNHENEVLSDGIFTALAPRVGFAYDISGSALRASVGRYYDIYNMYMVDNFCYYTTPETRRYYEPTDGVDGRNGWDLVRTWQYGTTTVPHTMDPNLTPQYVDEVSVGFDYLLSETMAVSITGLYRYYTAVTYTDLDGDYYRYWTNLDTPDHGKASKIYWGAVLEFRKRPTEDNLFLNANLTYMDTQGFYLDPFTGAYYTNPYQTDARIDKYWGDVVGNNWLAKAQATYFFPNNWYLGIQAEWDQGIASTTYYSASIPGYGTATYYPNGRADMTRLPDAFYMDIQFGIEQPIELPWDVPLWDDSVLLGIYVNVYNVFDNQDATGVRTLQTSGTYGQYNLWRQARNYELGFRIEL